ncbi:MmcQ/YjbR family DNA-binding protein [Erwinia sp. V71]|uniref:MmcQ/YjbR family DNA-binding protein n=1 Tax=Erwinia sp. V71 TaxID=3369424 RepID=UPI003F6389E8
MTLTEIAEFLTACRAAELSFPFGPQAQVYKVRGKMFATLSQREAQTLLTLKATPADVTLLVDEFAAIVPGYYMNKQHWISVDLNGDISDAMLVDLMTTSYQLVVATLKKSDREQLAR